MSKTAYTHMTATGEVKTRKSARTYTHVVVINDNGVHRVTNYAGSEALARKTANQPHMQEMYGAYVEAINNGVRA